MHMRTILVMLVALVFASGCSLLDSKKIDYKSAGTLPPLEAPPDLVMPAGDSRYAVPGAPSGSVATLSTYSQERGAKPSTGTSVLPQVDKVRIDRAGSQRWLVVDVPADRKSVV